ncbi:MAG: tRNA threonylcarbamoyladenosine dehydratase [Treponema sp.]|jgi:tRNA A37 threonylcarbamoyladenosine dehydratase|nr:tRNA threonylcarbamoyladenosine dehydratase [Treponema sp.]
MNISPSFHRLGLLIGEEAAAALYRARVLVFGLGGVGSWCAEALVRSGIGNITLIDFDKVEPSNINRQIEATTNTIGQLKTDALASRLKEINPDCVITAIPGFFSCKDEGMEHTAQSFGIPGADYIIDAIDSMESKLDLIETATSFDVTLFSSMGMARKLDPTRLRTGDIWKTHGCPLARNVREGLRMRGFKGNFTVVYSDEKAPQGDDSLLDNDNATKELFKKKALGSAVTVTAAAGMILASLVIRDICGRGNE